MHLSVCCVTVRGNDGLRANSANSLCVPYLQTSFPSLKQTQLVVCAVENVKATEHVVDEIVRINALVFGSLVTIICGKERHTKDLNLPFVFSLKRPYQEKQLFGNKTM